MASPSFTVFLRTTPTRKPIASTISAATIAPDPTSNMDASDAHFHNYSERTLKLSKLERAAELPAHCDLSSWAFMNRNKLF